MTHSVQLLETEAHYRRDATIYEGVPLPAARLAAIWRQLPSGSGFPSSWRWMSAWPMR